VGYPNDYHGCFFGRALFSDSKPESVLGGCPCGNVNSYHARQTVGVMIKFKVNAKIDHPFYDVVVGLGLYLTGEMFKNDKIIKKDMGKEVSRLIESIEVLRGEFKKGGREALLVVIDDCSPYKVDLTGAFDNYCIVELAENVGIGHKENILETVAQDWSQFLFRFDQDVKIMGPMEPLFDAFSKVPKLFCAGINSGFIGAMMSASHKGEDYVHTPQLANGVMEWTKYFDTIGYTDPNLKYFHDLDLFYRARDNGYETVMVMESKGSAVASRAAGTMAYDKVQDEAKYLVESNPSLKYYISKKGLPHIQYRPLNRTGVLDPQPIKKVPPSELALAIKAKVYEKRY